MKTKASDICTDGTEKANRLKISPARRAALLGVLGAQALALSFLENLIPAFPGLPPGAKPGFSNIVTMYAAYSGAPLDALMITLFKACFAGITRGATAFFMSLSGGLLSTLVMIIIFRLKSHPFGFVGLGVISALAHNFGQLATACVLAKTFAVVGYAPLLMFFGVATGFVTGNILKFVIPALKKQSEHIAFQK